MALEELRRSIEQEAKVAASKLEKQSDSEADAIIKTAHEEASATKKKAKEDAMLEAEQRRRDTLTAIEGETSAMLSAARENSIDDELKHFEDAIRKRLEKEQDEIIKAALKRFFDVIPAENASVRVSKGNAPLLKSHRTKIEYADIDGIILSSLDSRIVADATVDGLVKANTDMIRRHLAKGMFG